MRTGSTITAGVAGPPTCALSRARHLEARRRCISLLMAIAVFFAMPGGTTTGAAESAASRKYAVIAAFLYNFFLYVEWPDDSPLAQGPLRIGVLGSNPFGAALDALEKRHVEGRAIEVTLFNSVDEIMPTHILFLPLDATDRFAEVRKALRGQPVLTVGEAELFTRMGGVVRFFETGAAQRIGVEINQTAAAALHLRIRAKLLRLADLVDYPLPPIDPSPQRPTEAENHDHAPQIAP